MTLNLFETMDQIEEQAIRYRAYELWVAAGKPEGSHLRFWKEAQEQLAFEQRQAADRGLEL